MHVDDLARADMRIASAREPGERRSIALRMRARGSMTRLRRLVVLCSIVAAGDSFLGCSTKTCTLVGCGPAFEVRFQVSGGTWSPGAYDMTVTADGTEASCEVTLPLSPCQTDSSVCTGAPDWQVDYGGCALPPEQHAIYGITFWRTTPASVRVVFSRDDQQLAEGTFTPAYRSSEPNGPGCGDMCYGAPAAALPIQL
jgi:hypothetical protein